MIIQELLQEIDKQVPFSTSESWDNVGLLIGTEKSEVNGVLTTLDCTLEVVDEAIQNTEPGHSFPPKSQEAAHSRVVFAIHTAGMM